MRRALLLLACFGLAAEGCLNAVAELTILPDGGGTDAGEGPTACGAAGATCVIGPPSNCVGAVLVAYNCNSDRNPDGAICCLVQNDGGPGDGGEDGGEDAGSRDSGTRVHDAGPACIPSSGSAIDLAYLTPYLPQEFWASNVASGDLNGDGLLDLVAGGFAGLTLVFLGSSDGGLAMPPMELDAGGGPFAIVDLDQDGLLDIVTGDVDWDGGEPFEPILRVFYNSPDAGFTETTYSTNSQGVSAVGAGDINADGYPDLVICDGEGAIDVLLNHGDGTLAAPFTVQQPDAFCGAPGYGSDFVVADLNQDGFADVAAIDLAGALVVLLNQTDGGFETATYLAQVDGGPPPWSGGLTAIERTDGPPDLAFVALDEFAQWNTLIVMANVGDGHFQQRDSYPTLEWAGLFLFAADLNGDCVPDLVLTGYQGICNDSNSAAVAYGDGDGGFGPSTPLALSGGAHPAAAQAALLGPVAGPRALAIGTGCYGGISVLGEPGTY